jgi:hypothetical protein
MYRYELEAFPFLLSLFAITAGRLEVEENQLVSVFGEIGILFDGLKGA